MKKNLLLLVLLMTSLFALKAQDFVTKEVTNKNVLIEEFTGRKCINCPIGHIEAKAIEEAYPGRVWAINLHGGYYSSLDYPNLNTPICDTLGMYFNPNMFPSALINRQTSTTLNNLQWRAAVDEEIQKTIINSNNQSKIDKNAGSKKDKKKQTCSHCRKHQIFSSI